MGCFRFEAAWANAVARACFVACATARPAVVAAAAFDDSPATAFLDAEAAETPAALAATASAASPVAEAKALDEAPEAVAVASPPDGVTDAVADTPGDTVALFFALSLTPGGGGVTGRFLPPPQSQTMTIGRLMPAKQVCSHWHVAKLTPTHYPHTHTHTHKLALYAP